MKNKNRSCAATVALASMMVMAIFLPLAVSGEGVDHSEDFVPTIGIDLGTTYSW